MHTTKSIKRIAFSGKAGSGKTTAAQHLVDKHKFSRVSFAKPLYDVLYYAQKKFGFKKEKNREFLQFVGVWARKFAFANELPDPVLDIAKKSIAKHSQVVFDDLRMKVEYNLLKEMGFKMYRLTQREHDANNMAGGSKQHITEIDLDDVELPEVNNDGSIDDFKKKLDEIVKNC
jgi:ABC-type glutathione transport system ATPase component